MGKIWDYFSVDGDWEKYQRIQLYKKLGKKLEPEEQPKKMGFGEAVANLSVAIAQSRLRAKQEKERENKMNILYLDNKENIKSIQKGKRNIKTKEKSGKVYHLTKKELDRIIKNAIKKRK